jgi:hypothetical protein
VGQTDLNRGQTGFAEDRAVKDGHPDGYYISPIPENNTEA